jgi:hypothetical protein
MNINLTLKQAIILQISNRIKRASLMKVRYSLTSFIDSPSASNNSPSLLFFNFQNAFPNSGNENVIQLIFFNLKMFLKMYRIN